MENKENKIFTKNKNFQEDVIQEKLFNDSIDLNDNTKIIIQKEKNETEKKFKKTQKNFSEELSISANSNFFTNSKSSKFSEKEFQENSENLKFPNEVNEEIKKN